MIWSYSASGSGTGITSYQWTEELVMAGSSSLAHNSGALNLKEPKEPENSMILAQSKWLRVSV